MRSTAEARRVTVLNTAVSVFARAGFHATPVTAVAAAAGISEAYVFRLFSGKLGLFVAAAGRVSTGSPTRSRRVPSVPGVTARRRSSTPWAVRTRS